VLDDSGDGTAGAAVERRLSAILAADAVGYSRLMEQDEAATVRALAKARSFIDAEILARQGRIIFTAGDSVVAEFPSSVHAVETALAIQQAAAHRVMEQPNDNVRALTFRIGIHFGDVRVSGEDLLGDGINVAARLEALAPAGGICISDTVADQIVVRIEDRFETIGKRRLKNIARPINAWVWPRIEARRMRRQRLVRRTVPACLAAAIVAAVGLFATTYDKEGRLGEVAGGPRIAVLPFDEIGSGAEDAFFARGLSRDINALLADFSNLFVLAPDATASVADDPRCSAIRDRLDADFILAGTVRRAGDQLRVTTTFTDARTCRELAAPGPFDRELTASSVLDVQLEIAQKVVAQVGSSDAPIFDSAVVRDLRDEAPEDLTAYECVLLSYWFYENFAPDRHRRARACLEHAVGDDPGYSLGWSRLAFAFIESKKYSIDPPADWAERAVAATRRAIDQDPSNPDAYYARAILSQMRGEERSVFKTNAEKAIELNPNDAFILADLGTWMAYSGEWDKGKEWVSRAMLLNPAHQSWWHFIWQLHAFLLGDYETSLDVAQKVNLPGNYMVQAAVASAQAMAGKQAEARATLAHVLELKPDYALDPRQPFRDRGMQPELIESLMEGLRRAGLEVPAT
jgi:class 3 adenylate cyclase/TolB-like protein